MPFDTRCYTVKGFKSNLAFSSRIQRLPVNVEDRRIRGGPNVQQSASHKREFPAQNWSNAKVEMEKDLVDAHVQTVAADGDSQNEDQGTQQTFVCVFAD
jgi:hypothetical protein